MTNRKKMIIAFWIMAVAVILFTSVSFAWLSISSTPLVSDITITVTTDNALSVAKSTPEGTAGVYSTILDLETVSKNTGVLHPATYVPEDGAFYAPYYGIDGRTNMAKAFKLTDPETGDILPENQTSSGCYIFYTDFFVTCGSACNVAFSDAVQREDGTLGAGTFLIGEPEWNTTTFVHEDQGGGAQYAMRMAFLIEGRKDESGKEIEPATFIIYEPNADGGTGLKTTYSYKGDVLQGSNGLLLQQYCSTWEDKYPVLKDEVIYTPGEFIENENMDRNILFDLKDGEERHVRLYIWLEGQDADCTNMTAGGELFANIQFKAYTKDRESEVVPYSEYKKKEGNE